MKGFRVLAALVIRLAPVAEAALVNPDFETFKENGKPEGWYVPQKFRVMRGEGSNGSTGLVYENPDDPNFYQVPSQRFVVEPGGVYRFGAWVKVDRISGKGGVGIVFGWYGANGKWIGESQTLLLRQATDGWVKLDGVTRAVATNAVTGTIGFVVQRGVMGHIRFDRAYVERHVRRPVVGVYCSAYRSEASEGSVAFAAALTPEAFGAAPDKVDVRFEVKGADGSAFSVTGMRPAADEARAAIRVDRFALGTNEVTCVIAARGHTGGVNGGREVGRATTRFVRTAAPAPRKVWIDRHGRTMVDGKPFFPLGMYTGRMGAEHLARYADSAFNCLMQYGSPTAAEMKAFRDAGLKVIYDIASQYGAKDAGTNHVRHAIRKFGVDPSLLAWYLYDEQPTSKIPVLEARQRLVESLDPDHPTWCAQDIFSETRHYIGACDVFGGDPYPVSTRPVSVATDAIREETKGLMGMRPIWQVVQAFGWNWIRDTQADRQRRPTEAEIRNMAWQAIAGGARGLIFYSYSHYCRDMPRREPVEVLWPEMKRIAAEIRGHESVLLAAETSPISDAELSAGVTGRRWRTSDGETWRLLVNTSASTEAVAQGVTLPPLDISFEKVQR